MSALFDWLDRRVDLRAARRALLDREVPDRLTWWHTLGSATLAVFMVQMVTGIVLATFYSPSPDHAYNSIEYIQRNVASGSVLRGIHHWSASAMVILVVAHMIRVFSMGAYKYPREANWLLGGVLFVIVLGFSFTGYLLPWDQKAYWATAVGTSIAGTTPVVGSYLLSVLRGGGELGAATLSRFYALHVLLFPALLGGVVLLHLVLVIRQGIAPRTEALEEGAPARTDDPAYPEYYKSAYAATKRGGVRFYPDIIGKDVAVATLVIAPPNVSMPRLSGVTSSSSTSLRSPPSTRPGSRRRLPPTSSGLTPLCGSLPKNSLTLAPAPSACASCRRPGSPRRCRRS